jgi:transposase
MSRKRRNFGAPFKAKVALAVVRGDKTSAELATKFSVHSNQVTSWKKVLLEGAAELFEDGRGKSRDQHAVKEEELYEQIGRLKMELEWWREVWGGHPRGGLMKRPLHCQPLKRMPLPGYLPAIPP